jgi:hypothetical protein
VLVRQLGINDVPLSLQHVAEDGISGFLGRRFELIQRCLRLQGGDIGGRQIEGGELGHLIRGGIVDAADQHADMAHLVLLGQTTGLHATTSSIKASSVRRGLYPTVIRAYQFSARVQSLAAAGRIATHSLS